MVTVTKELKSTLENAVADARRRRHEYVTLEHLLLAISDEPQAGRLLVSCGADVAAIKAQLDEVLARAFTPVPAPSIVEPEPTLGFDRVIQQAVVHAAVSSATHVDSGALLVFMLQEEESHAAYCLRRQGIDRLTLLRVISHGSSETASSGPNADGEPAPPPPDPLEVHATDLVARAEANGYTLLVAGQAILAINKALYKKLSYDPAADFIFIGMLGVIANVLLVNPQAVPVNSLAELIALAKKKPGEISYGSNGPGSLTHLTTAILAQQAGMDLLHVPYQGAAPLMTDLIAGRIGITFTAASAALPLVQSGQLRAIAVTTGKRSRFAPNVPTLVESGFPSLDAPVWFGAVARTGTPAPIVNRLHSELQAILSSPDVKNQLAEQGAEAVAIGPEPFARFIKSEVIRWGELIRLVGVKID